MNDEQQIELLAGVLERTGDVIAALTPADLDRATPCAEYDVAALRNHVIGWLEVFAAGAHEQEYEGDPTAYVAGSDAPASYRAAAAAVLAGWREHGLDRKVRGFSGAMLPGSMIFGMTVMEYLAHGWDLARATDQDPGYAEAAAEFALATAQQILLPEYRGPEYFGAEVPVAPTDPAVDRFVGFMGRDPNWTTP
jgi:uncharacterized protein (TIGR03086 family)